MGAVGAGFSCSSVVRSVNVGFDPLRTNTMIPPATMAAIAPQTHALPLPLKVGAMPPPLFPEPDPSALQLKIFFCSMLEIPALTSRPLIMDWQLISTLAPLTHDIL